MRKDLKERAERYAKRTNSPNKLYFNRTVPDARYKGYRYFFKYINTHTVAYAFKTQKDLDDFLRFNNF